MPQTPDEQLHITYKSFGVFRYFEKKLSKFNSRSRFTLCLFLYTL